MNVRTWNKAELETGGAFLGSYLPNDPTRLSREGVKDGAQFIHSHGVGVAA